jgi:hypothetical protein
MKFKIKEGVVIWNLDKRMEAALQIISERWQAVLKEIPTITSCREGEHSATSLHYEGRAVDLRTRHLTPEQKASIKLELQRALGFSFDVIQESTHMHIELDRRADR